MGIISDVVDAVEDVSQPVLDTIAAEDRYLMKGAKVGARATVKFGSDLVNTDTRPPDKVLNFYQARGYKYIDTYSLSGLCAAIAIPGAAISILGLAIPTEGSDLFLLPEVDAISGVTCETLVPIIENISPEENLNCNSLVVYVFYNYQTGRADIVPLCSGWFR